MSGIDRYKGLMKPKEHANSVYDHMLGPIQGPEKNPKIGIDVYKELMDTTEVNPNASVDVNLSAIPVARPKKGIRDTHKTKAFYIRKDIAKLIDADIQRGQRGDMTRIVNALFEEYYKSQGRLK